MHRVWLVLVLFSGCAFGLSGPDPEAPRSKLPRCDTSKGLVALDGVMATTAGVIALALASNDETGLALLPLSIGGIYAAGAISGNNRVNECRKALDDYESYMAGGATAPAGDAEERPGPAPLPGPAVPAPAAQQPIAAAVPPPAPVAPAPVAPAPVAPAPIAVAPTQPAPAPVATAPAPVAAPAAAPAAKKPAPKRQPQQDDWSDFWREVE